MSTATTRKCMTCGRGFQTAGAEIQCAGCEQRERDIFNDVFSGTETDAQYFKRRCDYHEIRTQRR